MLCFGLDFKFTNGLGLVIATRSCSKCINIWKNEKKILRIVYDKFRREYSSDTK